MRCLVGPFMGNIFPKWPKKSSQEGSHFRFAKWNGFKNMKLFCLGWNHPMFNQKKNNLTAGSSTKIVVLFPVVFFEQSRTSCSGAEDARDVAPTFTMPFAIKNWGAYCFTPRNRGCRVAKVYLETNLPWLGVDFSEEWWSTKYIQVASPSRLFRWCEAFIQTARKIYENIQNNVYDLSSEAQREEDHSTDRLVTVTRSLGPP